MMSQLKVAIAFVLRTILEVKLTKLKELNVCLDSLLLEIEVILDYEAQILLK